MTVTLTTIGPLTINVGARRLTKTSPQALALLLYMTVERGKEISRGTLAELLFPGTTEVAGKHAIRQLVYRVRKMGAELNGDAGSVILSRDGGAWDIEAVEVRGHLTNREVDALGGGYLAGYAPVISEQFDEWLDHHRSAVGKILRRTLLSQLREEKARHRFERVDRIARACLALDPFNEEATLASAEALVMTGAKVEALSVLDRYIDEVGMRSRELRFAPKLLRERISQYVVDSGLLAEPPLVGRESEIATLRGLVSRVGKGTPEACVVWGSSGIGKTRLMNEACSIAALEGVAVVRCVLQPHDQRRPLAVLRDVAGKLLDLPGALGCSPDAIALMRGLCGRGAMPRRELPRTTQDSEVALAGVIAAAMDLVDAVCGEQSVLLCIEDAHWLDPASIELIVDAVAGQRALCILMASQRVVQFSHGMIDATRLKSIEVPRLSPELSSALLGRLFDRSDRPVDDEFVEWASALSGGVPFYLHALFVEYAVSGDRARVPSTLTASLAAKLDRLTEPSRSVFDAIVILGQGCTIGRLEALVQLPRHALLTSLRALEEGGLIRSTPTSLTCGHELYAVTARGKMPASVSRMLHRAAAELLENEREGSRVAPWDIAEHWAASGDVARGLSVMRVCARDALAVGRPQEGVELLTKAMVLVETEEERHEMLVDLLGACQAAGEWSRAAEVAAQVMAADESAGRTTPVELELAWIDASFHSVRSISSSRARLETICADRGLAGQLRARAAKLLICLAEDLGDRELGRRTIGSVEDLEAGDLQYLYPHLIYHTVFGDPAAAAKIAEQIAREAPALEGAVAKNAAFYNAAYAFWRSGKFDEAIVAFLAAYEAADVGRLRHCCVLAASQLAQLHWYAGNLTAAKHWFARAGAHLTGNWSADQGPPYHALGIMLALDEQRVDEAQRLLDGAGVLYPALTEDRRSIEYLAFQTRILLAGGGIPDPDATDRLILGLRAGRAAGMQDIAVDTALAALVQQGRCEDAKSLRREYLTGWRRDRFSIPPSLTQLHAGGEALRAGNLRLASTN